MMKQLILLIAVLCSQNLASKTQFYKYTDEEGNIHYTDEKPLVDEKEGSYKTLDIIGNGKIKKSTTSTEQKKSFNINEFHISTPQAGDVMQTNNDTINVSVNLAGQLPSNFRVRFYLDDIPHGKVKSGKQLIADVHPGAHKIYATLVEIRSMKVLNTTEVVEFELQSVQSSLD